MLLGLTFDAPISFCEMPQKKCWGHPPPSPFRNTQAHANQRNFELSNHGTLHTSPQPMSGEIAVTEMGTWNGIPISLKLVLQDISSVTTELIKTSNSISGDRAVPFMGRISVWDVPFSCAGGYSFEQTGGGRYEGDFLSDISMTSKGQTVCPHFLYESALQWPQTMKQEGHRLKSVRSASGQSVSRMTTVLWPRLSSPTQPHGEGGNSTVPKYKLLKISLKWHKNYF